MDGSNKEKVATSREEVLTSSEEDLIATSREEVVFSSREEVDPIINVWQDDDDVDDELQLNQVNGFFIPAASSQQTSTREEPKFTSTPSPYFEATALLRV